MFLKHFDPGLASKFAGSLIMLLNAMLHCVPTFAQSANETKDQWIAFNRAGAGNSNLQCFKPDNVAVSDGFLIISTKTEPANCSSIDLAPADYKYTSGFVSMRSFSFLYGTIEFRAKFGGGDHSGAWPVVWMNDAACQPTDPTGTDGSCKGEEIDIAEILDGNFERVNHQIHVGNFTNNDGCTAQVSDTSKNFHTYKLAWSEGTLDFSVDGVTTCKVSGKYVPSVPMYLKMNVFVGNYGGPVNEGSLPWRTFVDYVRIKEGARTLFEDDFTSGDTIYPAPYIPMRPPPVPWIRGVFGRARAHWKIISLLSLIGFASALPLFKFFRKAAYAKKASSDK